MFGKVFSAAVPFSSFINSPVFPDIYTKVENMLMLKKNVQKDLAAIFPSAHLKRRVMLDLPVSVKDWMSYVKSMFTLSAFSTFLKMIPINHIDTKSFLLEKNTKRARSLRICVCFDVLVERLWMKLDSLVPVLFRSRE